MDSNLLNKKIKEIAKSVFNRYENLLDNDIEYNCLNEAKEYFEEVYQNILNKYNYYKDKTDKKSMNNYIYYSTILNLLCDYYNSNLL